jgi:Leucine-rich repeat (LRR) protein
VLDLEGNNITKIDELYYLKKCKKLTDLNMSDNPVASEVLYHTKIQEYCTGLLTLDSQEISTETVNGKSFYDYKTDEAKHRLLKT